MKREILIEKIVDFYVEYSLCNKSTNLDELRTKIGNQLRDCDYLDDLINTIYVKTRYLKYLNNDDIVTMLLELEKIRLELEYPELKKCGTNE